MTPEEKLPKPKTRLLDSSGQRKMKSMIGVLFRDYHDMIRPLQRKRKFINEGDTCVVEFLMLVPLEDTKSIYLIVRHSLLLRETGNTSNVSLFIDKEFTLCINHNTFPTLTRVRKKVRRLSPGFTSLRDGD